MSVTAQSLKEPLGRSADLKLAVVGAVTVLFSIGASAAGFLGALSPGWSTALVMLGMGLGLKAAWTYVTRSASSASRTRIAELLSNVGLALSAVAVIAALPRLTKTAGVGLLLIDLFAQLWTLGVLLAAAGPARTVGWRALLGAFLFGFLGLTAFARFLGRPVIVALGTSSVLAVGIWVPLTEELCKMIPVILILVLARRRSDSRPSLLDVILVGSCAAAGFAVYENATYGRGVFSLTASYLMSPLFPGTLKGADGGWTIMQTGHLVHTALITLGVGFVLLYGHRLRRSWIVAAIALAASLIEHCAQNSIITGGVNKFVADTLLLITLNGRLSTVLLAAGIAYVAALEWRAVGAGFRPLEWLRPSPVDLQRRGARLAALQAAAPAADVAGALQVGVR